jgi:hypothetical protein
MKKKSNMKTISGSDAVLMAGVGFSFFLSFMTGNWDG